MKTIELVMVFGERVADDDQNRMVPEFIQRAAVTYDPKSDPDHMGAYSELVDKQFMDTINKLFKNIEAAYPMGKE